MYGWGHFCAGNELPAYYCSAPDGAFNAGFHI